MKKMLSMIALTLLPFGAAGADLPAHSNAPDDFNIPALQFDWSGFSFGVVGSSNAGRDVWADGDYPLKNSFFGGVRVGYDHQIGQFVLGGRVTGQLGSMKETDYPNFKYKSFLDFSARAGYNYDGILPYVAGGYSISEINEDGVNYTRGGYNFSAGIDYNLTKNVIIGFEYLHRGFDDKCEPHHQSFKQQINSFQAHVSYKF